MYINTRQIQIIVVTDFSLHWELEKSKVAYYQIIDCKDKDGTCIAAGSQGEGKNCNKVKCVFTNGRAVLQNIASGQ